MQINFNIQDFLDMKNNEILKENNGKKFDIVLMNPPYGTTGNDVTHLKFVEKCLDIADKQITVMPFGFITKTSKTFIKYKELFNKQLLSVDEIDGRQFKETSMGNVGIYSFDINKNENDNIKISRLNNKNSKEINSLLDISEFNDYEKEIIKYLENQGKQQITWAGGHDHCTKQSLARKGITDHDEVNKLIEQNIEDNCKAIPRNKVYLTCNSFNGGMNATFMSSKTGIIFDSLNDLINMFKDRKISSGYNLLIFNSVKEAENCKIALKNPVLRFTCWRTQNDQAMSGNRVYKYIPAIDWEDDRVKTDEGLLKVCGCPKDKCKEYAEYCKKIIDEVDGK